MFFCMVVYDSIKTINMSLSKINVHAYHIILVFLQDRKKDAQTHDYKKILISMV